METKSIVLQTLCIPCGCHCRYCLLSWDNHPVGADYEGSKRYARDFYCFIKKNHPEIQFDFAFGYCMEHPDLLAELDFLNEIGSMQGQFLQMDGMNFRTDEESVHLMYELIEHRVKQLNFTFYGLEAYHDHFAGRPEDFSHLLTMARSAVECGLDISAGIPLTAENTNQVEELIRLLEQKGVWKTSLFVPHEEGRGSSLSSVRFSEADYAKLSSSTAEKLNTRIFRPEREWVSSDWQEEQNRSLIISLTPAALAHFEEMSFEQVIQYVENLDNLYYEAIPTFKELCRLYGDPSGTGYYSKRDLFHHYQKRYIADHNLHLYDVTDERFCGSRRY